MRALRAACALALATMLTGTACGSSPSATGTLEDREVTVASFDFPESVLLAEIYAQAIEGAGYRVRREFEIGTRELVMPALTNGLVELVPEYSGSALEFLAGPGAASADAAATHESLVRELAPLGITALDPAPAQDQNGFAVTAATASRYGLRTLTDLTGVARELVFGGPPECRTRHLCLQGLASIYRIRFEAVVELDAGGPLTVAALASNQVQVALLFTSDGSIARQGFVLLEDDRHLQPAENVTPIVRDDVLERFGPGLADLVNAISAHLTTTDLRNMNGEVADGRNPADVAADWLGEEGHANGIETGQE